eukprot:CAMPEP_0115044908 /NCGR_PEP_ID=MMETSP0216-20121206/47820_1 /TAXON_ID=223996 /ORGANISM="Protocruzia adherens, Strain Boccale" /LENGTH=39 /DNA_ID= /DNA_START= /DNA_END= /DNA_ORIENTATION=
MRMDGRKINDQSTAKKMVAVTIQANLKKKIKVQKKSSMT